MSSDDHRRLLHSQKLASRMQETVSCRRNLRWIFLLVILCIFGGFTRIYLNTLSTQETKYHEEILVKNRLRDAESEWIKGKLKLNKSISDYNALQTNAWAHSNFRSFWDFFYPTFNCPHLTQRIGRLGDGGKWVCGFNRLQKKKDPCIVYSYGVSSETSFEKEILETSNCSVFMYDHTVDPANVKLVLQYPKRAIFYKLGLGTKNTAQLRTLKTELLKHHHEFIDILKIDVEGAEYDALTQMKSDFPQGFPFGQLLIELHVSMFPAAGLLKTMSMWWHALEAAGLRPFQNEVNFFCPLKCYEYSFINTGVDNFILHAYDKE